MTPRFFLPLAALFASATLVFAGGTDAIEKAMKYANKAPKGEKKISEKIVEDTATADETAKTLALYKAMRTAKPEKGEAAAFTEKTDKVITALEDVVAKKDGAREAFKKANNCKACHSEHKED